MNIPIDLKTLLGTSIPPNFVACIMWTEYGDNGVIVVHRYALWQGVGEQFNFEVPLYTGQKIAKNFRIEIWNTTNSNGTVSLDTALELVTSVLGLYDYRFATDSQLVAPDTINESFAPTNFPNLPYIFPDNATPTINT